MSVYEQREPIESKTAKAMFKVITYDNLSVLGILCPQYEAAKQGHLIDEDFKKYVMALIKDTGYIDIRWEHHELIGYKYITRAYVYYKKSDDYI